jgi:ketosteroid isomerase-like protein
MEGSKMTHPNEKLVRDMYDAFAAADMGTVDQLFADDVTWHAPGTAQHAGLRRGKQEVFASMGQLGELTGGTLRSEVVDVLANDRRAVVLQVTRAEREGRTALRDEEVIVYEIDDGRITSVREQPGDLDAMDAFFS